MTELLYEWMTPAQATAALEEYLAERDPALQQLRTDMADHGIDPAEMLDGTVGSVVPVWEWITTLVAELGVDPRSLPEDPTRPGWPSWARHGMLVDPHPPAKSLGLVDGFASYLGQILTTSVPEASWQIGHHRINDFPMLHRPVLAAAEHQVFLPGLPIYSVYQSAHGRDPMTGTEMVEHVRRTISGLRGQGPEAATAEEPYVTVVPEVGCFDVGLRTDIAEEHSSLVDRMIAALIDRDGVDSVHRYGAAALVVNAASWEELRLQMWLTLWLQRHLPTDH